MSDQIQCDYDRMDGVANKFAAQAQAVQQMLQNIRSSMDPLVDGGWIGRGSDAFYSEMEDEVLPANQRLQEALEEASRVSKYIVQTVKQAEEEASSPFRVR